MTHRPVRILLGPLAQELAQKKAGKEMVTRQHLEDAIRDLQYAALQSNCPLAPTISKRTDADRRLRFERAQIIADIGDEDLPS